jgi:hypothetical protein
LVGHRSPPILLSQSINEISPRKHAGVIREDVQVAARESLFERRMASSQVPKACAKACDIHHFLKKIKT